MELGKLSSTSLVWRRIDKENDPRCIIPTFKSGKTSVMVWGCIAYNKKGPLVFIPKDKRLGQDYVDSIMAGPLWDFYAQLYDKRGVVLVMEDNAPTHTCRSAKIFRDKNLIDIFPHLAQSPDMNPIEHVWYLIKITINKRAVRPRNEEEMRGALLEKWEKININIINKLINSMFNHVQ